MKFKNGIREIKVKRGEIAKSDLFLMALSSLGCSVSSMPSNYKSEKVCNKTELFDPEKVEFPEDLPEYWKNIWNLHNEPKRYDCIRFRYRYVHVPYKILPSYPRVPCEGVFGLTSRKVKWNQITENDLVHLGSSTEEGW